MAGIFFCFSSKRSTEAKARTMSKKDLRTPGKQADTVLSLQIQLPPEAGTSLLLDPTNCIRSHIESLF